jgi:hypothetical protein
MSLAPSLLDSTSGVGPAAPEPSWIPSPTDELAPSELSVPAPRRPPAQAPRRAFEPSLQPTMNQSAISAVVAEFAGTRPRAWTTTSRDIDFGLDVAGDTPLFADPKGSAQSLSESTAEVIPYGSLIRELLVTERISVARQLVAIALRDRPESPQLLELSRVLAPSIVAASLETDSDREQEYEWLRLHSREYRGRWVAVSDAELLVDARTLKELLSQLRDLVPARKPLIHRIP